MPTDLRVDAESRITYVSRPDRRRFSVPRFWRLRMSVALLSVLIFMTANFGLLVAFKKYKQDLKEDFAAAALQRSPVRPDVVLVGSSMMLYPMVFLDQDSGHSPDSPEGYTRSQYMEESLLRTLGRRPRINDVAYMGFMISDDYFIVDSYLNDSHTPKAIVLFVGPRDFYDSSFQTPAAGIAFQKLAGWNNFMRFRNTYLTSPSDYIDFIVGQTLIMYAIRAKFQEKIHDRFVSCSSQLQPAGSTTESPHSRREKSLREYRQRYRGIALERMDKQFLFFDRLLDLCKQRGIRAVVVNAPITADNQALLPDGLYQGYDQRLSSIASRKADTYIDLANSRDYTLADFNDTVHLNAHGARKLVTLLSAKLVPMLEDANHRHQQ